MKKYTRTEMKIYLDDILNIYNGIPEKKSAFLGSFMDLQELAFDFTNKSILEVGCDTSLTSAKYFIKLGAKHVVATNLSTGHIKESHPRISLYSCDAGRYSFEQQFDFIYGRAILEHVSDIKALAEMVKTYLTPGGAFFFDGGPMWDSDCGHHVWVTSKSGNLYTFVKNSPVLPYEHLKCDEKGLCNVLKKRLNDEKEAIEIAYYVYNSPDQNRLYSNQIIQFFLNTGLNIHFEKTVGCDIPQDIKKYFSSSHAKAYSRLSIRSSNVPRN